jgi:hypothetical protein
MERNSPAAGADRRLNERETVLSVFEADAPPNMSLRPCWRKSWHCLIEEGWLRGLDSNQDSQIQSLESYQLDDPGAVENFGLILCSCHDIWVNRGKILKSGRSRYSGYSD